MVFGFLKRGQKDWRESESEDWNEPKFRCERLCTTPKLLEKLGNTAKDPTPNTCVTVCGTSGLDACTDACQRTACANAHHVPAWNDACLQRCASECMKLQRSR
ncbi:hypothetical protein DUNSADRAFT_2979 [Dunaliella salina]|uniref:Uncharacterized protein n=1 Tax=Dunaliella salina TaxID=3046 RepID=A0ABQ7GUY4_DUNSA|nr:hypothetical protein DUNSADRAFT_2979 [Dunaliella salina]|eukprot:KAF5838369.1 hypothetical protein DUNSADRAFT_2979 [Dunaliella salina]